jgi:hypothetical protein
LAAASGVPLHQVKDWLGHASLATTEKFYLHACPERNRASEGHFERMMEGFGKKPKAIVAGIKKTSS